MVKHSLSSMTNLEWKHKGNNSTSLKAQVSKSSKEKHYDEMNASAQKGQTVFFGDSLTEFYDLGQYFPDEVFYNRGISGDTTDGMLNRLDNNLLELIAADPAFNLSLEDLQKTMDPSKYVGRAKEQVEAYLNNVINPLLQNNKDVLGMTAEINV